VALRALRAEVGDDLVLIPDLCLDEYTDHGHCGILDASGGVDNDLTLLRYGEIAIAQAAAGADFVAPSGMMDGQVGGDPRSLDGAGYATSESSPTPQSTPRRSTGLSATPSTSPSPAEATGGPISRIRRTPVRRLPKCTSISPRVPTW
jgi:hypothetical protein